MNVTSLDRARLSLVFLAPALVVVLAVVVVSLIALAGLDAAASAPEAGLARVGDDLALVIVTDGPIPLDQIRSTIATWGLAVPALVLVAASVVAWLVAGRVHRTTGEALQAIQDAEAERMGHLQEVVHELRTPLAVMGTNLELAEDPAAERNRYIDAARRAVERMSRTVDDLAGHGALAVADGEEPVGLGELAGTVALEHVGPGLARGVQIALVGDEEVTVPGPDPAAVRSAAGNFLSNAIRHAPRGSTVAVDWGTCEDWAWLSVTDEGPGLAPEQHARVFERGWQGAHDRDRAGGSGLGLTIARQLTEAQGGAVTLVSEEGGGATFALWLPLGISSVLADVVAGDGIHPRVEPWVKTPATA